MNDQWRFRIYQGRFGWWHWYATGRGIWNLSYPKTHLPRRSRQACVERANEYAQHQTDKRRRIHEHRYEVPA